MGILKFIKSLFVKEQPVTITQSTTLPVLAGEAVAVVKKKKIVKKKK